jgi:hypothetical protein
LAINYDTGALVHDFGVVWNCKTSKSRQCTCNDISNCSSIYLTHFDIWMHKSVDCSVYQRRIIASINTVDCENVPVGAMVKPTMMMKYKGESQQAQNHQQN